MAIPFLLIEGYHTLLDSRTGTFAEERTPQDPGWAALVEPTPITGVVEIDDGRPSGLALVVTPGSDDGQRSGSVVLVPASAKVVVDGEAIALNDLAPAAAIRTLAQALMLDLVAVETMDADAWTAAMGETTYDLDNPDPVPASDAGSQDDGQQLAFAVGSVVVDGSNAAVFLGRPVEGAALESVGPRRHTLWSALLADPPDGDHGLSEALRQSFDQGSGQLLEIPVTAGEDGLALDIDESEALLREIVPFPSGPRLKVRVVDRTGTADLGAIAALVAGRGIEVVEIANAVQFDSGPTELIVPDPLPVGQGQVEQLAAELGVDPVIDYEPTSATATLLVGADFALP